MTSSYRHNHSDFTRSNYRKLLKLARDAYTFRNFTDFDRDERFVLWRHDVDASVQSALCLAEIEADEALTATYLFNLHCVVYSVFEKETTDCIREIQALGHQLGLHFEAAHYGIRSEDELQARLSWERGVLEDLFGQEIRVFSFHNPAAFELSCRAWKYAGMINTNAEYFREEVGYCSDSNGYWRFRRLEDVLTEAEDERLQVLTHPAWWQETVMPPRQRIQGVVDERGRKIMALYDDQLDEGGRENID
jgi:hypothetical protein